MLLLTVLTTVLDHFAFDTLPQRVKFRLVPVEKGAVGALVAQARQNLGKL